MHIVGNARRERRQEKRWSLKICFRIPIFQVSQTQCQSPLDLNNAVLCNMGFTFCFLHVIFFFIPYNFALLYQVHYSFKFQYFLAIKACIFLNLSFIFLNLSITNPSILTISVESNCIRAKVASFKISHVWGGVMFFTKGSIEENIHEQIRNQKILYACHYLSKLNLLLFYNFIFSQFGFFFLIKGTENICL